MVKRSLEIQKMFQNLLVRKIAIKLTSFENKLTDTNVTRGLIVYKQ